MKALTALLLLLWWSEVGFLKAEEPIAVKLRCLGQESEAVEPSTPPLSLHVFGGSALAFLVAVDAPLGTRMSLRADLAQTATGGLAVPVQTDVAVSGELGFETRTHLIAACTLPGVPAVQRPTRLILKLRGVIQDHAEPLSPTAVELWVYPSANPGEWKKTIAATLAQGGMTRLEVFGQGSRLRRFLKERHVEFEDGGAQWFAAANRCTLYVGDEPPPIPTRITSVDGLHVVLFQPPGLSTFLPGVYQSNDSQGGAIVKITLPDLLTRLPDDPRAQQTVAAVLRQGFAPHQPTAANPTPNP